MLLLQIICVAILLFLALIYCYALAYMIAAGASAALKRTIIEYLNIKKEMNNG